MEHPLLYINIPGMEEYPHIVFMWVIMALLVATGFVVSRGLKMVPRGAQNFLELAVSGVADFMDESMGKGGRRFLPLIGTLGFFILISNLMGLVPGFAAPTANINTNAAMALVVFLTYNFVGIRKHGAFGYLKHFMGPIPWLAPLIFPLEIITHLARPLTLTVRLFGNIFGEELVLVILAFLIPLFLPVPMMFLAIFTGLIQSVIFALLSMFYIAGALEEEH
ncbi:MAG: F0F1 ATP synthase subunit A [Nitrospinota bacterium]